MRIGRALAALIVAAAPVAAAPAVAADMPVPATPGPAYYPATPLPPARYDWTGLYFGGNVGAGHLLDTITQSGAAPAGGTTLTGSTALKPVGVIAGPQAGVNVQFGPVVIGGEATWTSSNITGSGITNSTGAAPQERANSNPQWFATATGRAGIAANDLLFYGKAGEAWMKVNYVQDTLNGGATVNSQTINDTRRGFTAGAGIEYGLTENFSARLEYDFYDFGTRTYAFAQTPVSIKSDLHALTFGLNYRFTVPGGWAWH